MENKESSIRFLTYNLAGLKFDWFSGREEGVIGELKKLKPDIVALQEVGLRHEKGIYNQAREIGLGIALPYSAFALYGNPLEVMSPEQGGVAILSRWPILTSRNRHLPHGHANPPDERVALLSSIDSPIGELDVITTHLTWRADEAQIRLIQAGLIFHDFTGPKAKTVLMGDLNAVDTEPCLQLLKKNLKDAFRDQHPHKDGFTWSRENKLNQEHSQSPDRRIDYILCPKNVEVRRCDIVLDKPAGPMNHPLSDHYALMADLVWDNVGVPT